MIIDNSFKFVCIKNKTIFLLFNLIDRAMFNEINTKRIVKSIYDLIVILVYLVENTVLFNYDILLILCL